MVMIGSSLRCASIELVRASLNVLRSSAVLPVSCVILMTGCSTAKTAGAVPLKMSIAAGQRGGVTYAVASAISRAVMASVPEVTMEVVATPGVDETLATLQRGQAQLALVDSETAYVGYRTSARKLGAPDLKTIAVMFPTVVHLFVRSDLHVSTVAQFRGLRLAVGDKDGYADLATRLILSAYGLDSSDVRPVYGPFLRTAADFAAGNADGAVFYTPFRNPALVDVVTGHQLVLVPIERKRIAAVQSGGERDHFLKTVVIPANTYAGQSSDVVTIGEDFLLICRADLPEDIVYRITRAMFESLSAVHASHPAARSVSIAQGPTAAVPLHAGATRFYRERELLQ